ncbi:MAG: M28 family peptidase [Gemmatimonadetes bacterium]|nr:M28 family peptidase [Gemmatimonadota bacterium]
MFLAGDGFRGRLTDTPENALALEWVKSRFEWLGLEPMGVGGSYFAPYQLMVSALGTGNELTVEWGTATSRHPVGADYHPRAHSGSGRATGPVAFVGYGISAPALSHDDLTGDLRGKVLLVLDGEPEASDPRSRFDGVVNSEYASQLRKTVAAQARGAVAVLFVTDPSSRPGPENFDSLTRAYWPATPMRLPRYSLAAWYEQIRIPAGQISTALAERLLAPTGKTLAELAKAAGRSAPPLTIPGPSVTIAASVPRTVVPDRNVVAALRGSDPALRDEFVLIAAHVDHNGADGNQIFAGADDNGSGTVGLLAIAEAYSRAAAAGRRPRRSVLFVALNTEERGPLLGSWGYTEAPVVPLARTVAMLNMDMIGRNEEVPPDGGARFRGLEVQSAESNRNAVNLVGWSRSASLTALVERANAAFGLELRKPYDNNSSQLLRRSDQWPFLHNGVPAVNFFTGLHPDYHRVEDRPERIEYAKMERIVRLVHEVSWALANDAPRPTMNAR